MKVKVTVDRIEKDTAVLLIRPEENKKVDWPLAFLPEDTIEGDILNIEINRDEKTKENSKKRVENLINKLKNKGKED